MSKEDIRTSQEGERLGAPSVRELDGKSGPDVDRVGANETLLSARGAAFFGGGDAEPWLDPRSALALQSAIGNHHFSQLVAARQVREAGFRAEQYALSRPDGGLPIPGPLRSVLAGVVACDLDEVRLHTNERAAATASALGARAFTVEQDVSFASGEYAPHTPEGLRLLVHELKHVEQYARGMRPGTIAGRPISDPHDPLEREADAASLRVSSPPTERSPGAAEARSLPRPRRAARGASPMIMRQPRAGAADDRIEVIADRAKRKLRVVRINKRGEIVAGLAEITPPEGESLEAASVEAKLHETSRLTDTKGTYKIKLPPRYTATTNPKETVQVKRTTPKELARKEADRKKVEEFLEAQDAEFGTNLKALHMTELADEEKVAEIMRSEGYQKHAQKLGEKRYWTEVKRLMELDRESIKEAYLAGGVVLSDKEADDTWVDRELEKPWDENQDRPKPHMSVLQQWEARNRARAEQYLYVQEQRVQALGFAEEQAEVMAHRVAPGSKSSAAEQQEARSWAALAGRDLVGDDAATRQRNAQVRAHRGDLVEYATQEAAWATMHFGENSPEARHWKTVLDAHAKAMKTGGFDEPWRPNMKVEAQQNAEDFALRQRFERMYPGMEGLSVKEMREILRRGRSRQELSSWEREHLDKHGTLPNEVTDERGILRGYKLYSYEQLGLNGGVGQVTEEVVDVTGKRQSITRTVTLTPALEFFEDASRSIPYLSTAISAAEAYFGRSLHLRDLYSEMGRELSLGERMEALLNGLPSVGPIGKVAHYAGRIMLAKAALEVTTGLNLSGPGIDAILTGKPVWLTPDERAQRALHGAVMHIAYSGLGAVQGTIRNRGAIDASLQVEPRHWRDPGQAPDASEGAPFQTTGRHIVEGVAGLGETLMASGMKPGVPALVYHEGVPLIAEMHEGAPEARQQGAGGDKGAVVEHGIEEPHGKAPKAEYRQEPTPAQRGEAWEQIDAILAEWRDLGIPQPEVTANMDLPTAWIHESPGSPTRLRRINLGYNLAPATHLEDVPLTDRANAALSARAAASHEATGHYEAFVAGRVHPLHEETQASLRAAILAPNHTLQERSGLILDAVARLQYYEQGTPAPGRENLRSRWQRPTLVLPPGLWLERLQAVPAPGPRPLASGAPPAAVEIHGVEQPRGGRPAQRAGEPPVEKAGQSLRSAAEEAREESRRAREESRKAREELQSWGAAQRSSKPAASVGGERPPVEAPGRTERARPANAPGKAQGGEGAQEKPVLNAAARANLDARISAACRKSPYMSEQIKLERHKILKFMTMIEEGQPLPPIPVENNELIDGHHRYIASLIVNKPLAVVRPQDSAMRRLSKAAQNMARGISEAFGTVPTKPKRELRPIKNADFVLVD